eukprot:IDg20264t1
MEIVGVTVVSLNGESSKEVATETIITLKFGTQGGLYESSRSEMDYRERDGTPVRNQAGCSAPDPAQSVNDTVHQEAERAMTPTLATIQKL